MSKSLEEMCIIGFVALLALKFMTTGAQVTATTALQNSTVGQTAGFASIAEGLANTWSNDFS